MIYFLEIYQLLSKNKYGSRPGLSTENVLYKVTQFLYRTLDNSNKSITICLDIANQRLLIQRIIKPNLT